MLSVVARPEQVRDYEADGFVVFEDPTRAVVAIHAMGRFGDAFAATGPPPPPPVPPFRAAAIGAERGRGQAHPGGGRHRLRARRPLCRTAEDAVRAAAGFGDPVVMKIVSPDIIHKSEIGGVLLGVAGPDAVRAGFASLMERARHAAPEARIEGVLVAKQLQGGVECIMGIHRDPVFGPVALFGLGGIFVEVLQDVALHRCPFGPDVAERMIRSIRAAPILLGRAGGSRSDMPALATMLSRLSQFAHQAGPRLQGIDLNPVLAMPEGAYAVDAVIELAGG